MLFLVGIPLLVEIGITLFPWNGSDDGWLGFWGSYLGIIPSGLIAYFVAKVQIDAEKNNYRKNHLEDMLLDDLRELYGYLANFKESVERFSFDTTVEVEEINYFIRTSQENMMFCAEMENVISRAPNYNKKSNIEILVSHLKNSLNGVRHLKTNTLKSHIDKNKIMEKQLGMLMFNEWPEGFSQDDLKQIQNEEEDSRKKWENESERLQDKINMYVESYNSLEKLIRDEINRLSNI